MPAPRLDDSDLGRRSIEAYQRFVQPILRPDDMGKFLAIDLLSGDFEINEDDYTAVTKLQSRRNDAEVFLMLSDGSPAVRLRSPRVIEE